MEKGLAMGVAVTPLVAAELLFAIEKNITPCAWLPCGEGWKRELRTCRSVPSIGLMKAPRPISPARSYW